MEKTARIKRLESLIMFLWIEGALTVIGGITGAIVGSIELGKSHANGWLIFLVILGCAAAAGFCCVVLRLMIDLIQQVIDNATNIAAERYVSQDIGDSDYSYAPRKEEHSFKEGEKVYVVSFSCNGTIAKEADDDSFIVILEKPGNPEETVSADDLRILL